MGLSGMMLRIGFRAPALLAVLMFSTAAFAAEIAHQTDYSIALAGLPLAGRRPPPAERRRGGAPNRRRGDPAVVGVVTLSG
jgi:hypothetical protein